MLKKLLQGVGRWLESGQSTKDNEQGKGEDKSKRKKKKGPKPTLDELSAAAVARWERETFGKKQPAATSRGTAEV